MSLFADALGSSFDDLPAPVRSFHDGILPKRYGGTAEITRGLHPLASAALWLGGFPPAGQNVAVTVTVDATEDGELWTRDFGGHCTVSTLHPAGPGAVDERFGPVRIRLNLTAREDGLALSIAGAWIFGLALPKAFWPISRSFERADKQGHFVFDIAGDLPLAGTLIRYHGSLTAQE